MSKLLQAFTLFFQENSGSWLKGFEYRESGPHLLMMAFLQRVINGGGMVYREYALGSKRVDLTVTWKKQKIVIELKIYEEHSTLLKGLEQTAEYMDKSGATEGHLVLFDRDPEKTWKEKIYHREQESLQGTKIEVWGL